jgi:hypothetical protein
MTFESEKQRDEIHRKIGRNISLLQKVELALKFILSKSNLSFTLNTLNPSPLSLQDQLQQQKAAFTQKTMGCVSRLFCERVLTEPEELSDSGEIFKGEARLTFGFNILSDSEDWQDEFKGKLNAIVEDRNRLVHHLFTTFNFSSSEGLNELDIFLDQQHCKALSLSNDLTVFIESIQESDKLLSLFLPLTAPTDCLKSPYVQEIVAYMYLHSTLSANFKKSIGTCLASAGKFIRNQCPEAFSECQKKYGVKSFKKLILQIGFFDLLNEGGTLFYRLKPEHWIEDDKDGYSYLCKRSSEHGVDLITKESLGLTVTAKGLPQQSHLQDSN